MNRARQHKPLSATTRPPSLSNPPTRASTRPQARYSRACRSLMAATSASTRGNAQIRRVKRTPTRPLTVTGRPARKHSRQGSWSLRSWNSSSSMASSLEAAAIPNFTSLEQALAQTSAAECPRPSAQGSGDLPDVASESAKAAEVPPQSIAAAVRRMIPPARSAPRRTRPPRPASGRCERARNRPPGDQHQEQLHGRRGRGGTDQAGLDLRCLRERGQLPARCVHLRGRRRDRLQGRRPADQQQDLAQRRRGHPGGRGLPRGEHPHRPAAAPGLSSLNFVYRRNRDHLWRARQERDQLTTARSD